MEEEKSTDEFLRAVKNLMLFQNLQLQEEVNELQQKLENLNKKISEDMLKGCDRKHIQTLQEYTGCKTQDAVNALIRSNHDIIDALIILRD